MAIAAAPQALQDARAALAAEWTAASPQTPAAIAAFYRTSTQQTPDLEAWHATETRQHWTRILTEVAQQVAAVAPDRPLRAVDIGCGLGHDLAALRAALPAAVLVGVEPNQAQHDRVIDTLRFTVYADVSDAPIETADLLVCIDVLEHVPDPEGFLGAIAQRAPLGCTLVETTATHHVANPLHLRANIGWRPGRVLDQHGWQVRWQSPDPETRVRVWERTEVAAAPRAALLLCAYRNLSVATAQGIAQCLAQPIPAASHSRYADLSAPPMLWRWHVKEGDGLITRSRAILLSQWWAECADDVALMIDDDIGFTAEDALNVVQRCRETRSVVCGAYPVGDGSHFACRFWPDTDVSLLSKPDLLPIEYAATGFMAMHRDVVDAVMASMDWVHEDQPWAFKPMFEVGVVPQGDVHFYVSEDWHFSHLVRQLGYEIYLDPRVMLSHYKTMPMNIRNMHLVQQAIAEA